MKIDLYSELLTIIDKQTKGAYINYNANNEIFFNNIQSIFAVGDYYYFTINYVNFSIENIHENVKKVLGYPLETINMEFAFNCMHPDDVPYFLNFGHEVDRFFSQLPPDKVMKYKTRYDIRVKKADGSYIRVLNQGLIIQIDENGGIIRKLIIQTDISEYKKNSVPTLSFIGLDDEPSFINVEVNEIYKPTKNILSSREKQILILLAEGRSRFEISEKLFISRFTVDNHKKNILEKTKTKSVSELILKAINEGWM